jgi:hypothetical protein
MRHVWSTGRGEHRGVRLSQGSCNAQGERYADRREVWERFWPF